MREYHPVTDLKKPPLREKKIILGSFPTHRFTRKSEEEASNENRGYFYGGERNLFWLWYAEFVDKTAVKESVTTLKRSLSEHRIGITDMIWSCDRKGNSASDNDLKNRIYNYGFLSSPGKNETLKILCTSKGVMNDMLLSPAFFRTFPDLKINPQEREMLTEKILSGLRHNKVSAPLANSLESISGGKIEIVALPSPGSPFRSLKNFGFQKGDDAKAYLKTYLSNAFRWFLE